MRLKRYQSASRKEVILVVKDKYSRQKKYNDANTVVISIRLNKKTDQDIFKALEGKKKQTEIKRLIRKSLLEEGLYETEENN